MDAFLSAVLVWLEYIVIGVLLRIGWLWTDHVIRIIKSLFCRKG